MKLRKTTLAIALVGLLVIPVAAPGIAFAEEGIGGDSTTYTPPTQEEIDAMWAEVDEMIEESRAQAIVPAANVYPRTKGYVLVTKDAYKDLIPTGHAAIVYTSNTVIESLGTGVQKGPNNWTTSKKTCYGLNIYAASSSQQTKAADWAARQIGKPYSMDFLNPKRTDQFYCSQLVWQAYLSTAFIDICPVKTGGVIYPPDLLKSPKTSMIVYTK